MRHINHFSPFLAIATVLMASVFVMSPRVHAQTSDVSLTAMPAILDAAGTAGGEAKVSFQVKNNSDTTLPIHMTTRDGRTRNGQPPELMSSLSAKKWVNFAEENFILDAGGTRTVEATLRIPKGTAGGGYYADLVVQPLSLQSDDGIIAAKPELAVQMLVSVAGDIKNDLQVTLTGPSTVFVSPSGPRTVSYEVKNNGNIHALFMPKLQIKTGKDKVTGIDAKPQIILPGEVKTIDFDLPKGIRSGVHTAAMTFGYGTPTKQATSPGVRLIIVPIDPKLLLLIPLLAAGFYAYKHRNRLSTAVRIITKGEQGKS